MNPDHQRRVFRIAEARALDVSSCVSPTGSRHRNAVAVSPEQRTSSEGDRQRDGRLARSATTVFDLELRGARTDRLRLPADGGKSSMTRVEADQRGRRDGEHSWSLPVARGFKIAARGNKTRWPPAESFQLT